MPDDSGSSDGAQRWVMRLFVAGSSEKSQTAIRNLKRICKEQLADQADVEIIDLYEDPSLAREFQIVAAPTLEKLAPPPFRRLLGDLSDEARVFAALQISDDEHEED